MTWATAKHDQTSEREQMANAMLDLAEQALRACLDAGMETALRARLDRMLGTVAPANAPQTASDEPGLPPAGALDQVQLSRVLGSLKAARASRLTPAELAANMLARADVVSAMRAGLPSTSNERAAA